MYGVLETRQRTVLSWKQVHQPRGCGKTKVINLKSKRRQIVKDLNIILNSKLRREDKRWSLQGFNRKCHIWIYTLERLFCPQFRQGIRNREI